MPPPLRASSSVSEEQHSDIDPQLFTVSEENATVMYKCTQLA